MDGTVLGFALALSLITGFAFGLLPGLVGASAKAGPKPGTSRVGSGLGRRGGFARSLLSAAQIAGSVVLLVGSGLLVRSFQGLQSTDVGFNPENLATMAVSLSGTGRGQEEVVQFYRDLPAMIELVPGVRAVAAVNALPISGGDSNGDVTIEGRPFEVGEGPTASFRRITPGYFETVGTPIVRGREFANSDLGEVAGRIAALGYRPRLLGEESTPDRDLLLRLGVASFAAMNVMMMSGALYLSWFGGMEARFVALFQWVSLVLATPVALWSAMPFFVGAWTGLRERVLHMDVPIAIAVAVLYAHGLVGTLAHFDTYLDSLTMLVALLLAGRMLESRGRRRASEAAVTLAASVPTTARRVVGDSPSDASIETVASSDLIPGDEIAIGAGEELPADGVVASGTGSLRVALLTGESEPVQVGVGDRVWAGTVLVDGALIVSVTEAAEDTVISRMADELRAAADQGVSPSSTDRIAPWFTGVTLAVAALTFVGWWLAAGVSVAMSTMIAVLVVACPCALALSRPLAASAGLGAAARRGLLMRSADALLALAEVDTVVLDKTGTVTAGALDVVSAGDADLRVAAGLERFSMHPVALAVVREAVSRGIPLPAASGVSETAGVGISGEVDGAAWSLRSGGAGLVVLEGSDGYRGLIRLGDRLRADSAAAVRRLRSLGLSVSILTGDHREAATRVASAAGVAEADVDAGVPANEKPARIRALQEAGRVVLFAGDGLNDGPALAIADVGVAMGTGSASSVLAADGVLAVGSVGPLALGVVAARACKRAVRGNQARSIMYNVVAVSAAAAGFVNPLVAAMLMPLSSAMVLWGASRVESQVRAWEISL